MFRRLIERFKKIFVCSSNPHTRGNQVLDVDVSSVRSVSRAANKKFSKKRMIGLVKILPDSDFVKIVEIGVHDKDAWNIECSICLENIDYEEDIRFIGGTGTTVNDGDRIAIVPAIAGGNLV